MLTDRVRALGTGVRVAKVLRFPDATRAHEDAALWLARLDKGVTDDERAALAVWLGESSMNREALLELASLWNELDVLAELSDLFPLERRRPARLARRSRRWLLAASVAPLAVGAFVVFQQRLAPVAEVAAVQKRSETFTTAIGGHATQELADGSVLTLNTDTGVDVELAAQSRDVYLRRGEAYFAVARDTARPFRVHVGDRVFQAVGTAFNVYLRPEGSVELTVTDGTVTVARAVEVRGAASADRTAAVTGAEPDAIVVEGEAAIIEHAAGAGDTKPRIVRLEAADLDIRLAWQRGMLIFQGEPLQQILAEVGRYTTTEFVLADDALRDVRVGGYFRADDVDGLLEALRENFQIEFERPSADRVVLRTARAAR